MIVEVVCEMSEDRIVVVGCGSMANVWVEYMVKREDSDIVALVDIKSELAQATGVTSSLRSRWPLRWRKRGNS